MNAKIARSLRKTAIFTPSAQRFCYVKISKIEYIFIDEKTYIKQIYLKKFTKTAENPHHDAITNMVINNFKTLGLDIDWLANFPQKLKIPSLHFCAPPIKQTQYQ